MRLPLLFLIVTLGVTDVLASTQYPLSISTDGRAIRDASGKEIVFNADTPWHLLARLDREETIEYLDARASQGINAMLMSLVVAPAYSTGSTDNAYGDAPFLAPGDFSRPNQAYFSHVDWVLERARERNITIFLMPVYLGYNCGDEGWCAEVIEAGSSEMRDFGRWVGTRYQSQPNIIWIHGGDVDADLFGVMDEVDALVEGIQEVDANHLHTAHCDRFSSATDCYERPWLDLDTTYSDCDRTPQDIRDDFERLPARTTVYIEGRYEFEYDWTGECLRAQAYWSALGGARGHFFGSGRVWDFPQQWREGLFTEGYASMKIFGALLGSRGWESFVPDYAHNTVIAGYGSIASSNYASAALSKDHNSLVVYLPSPRTITVAMSRVAGTEAEAWWIDPSTGEGQSAGNHPTTGTRNFSPPSGGTDWVLVVDNAAADLVDVWNEPTAVVPSADRHASVRIESAIPNPFNPRTTVRFRAPVGERVRLAVFDVRGREVEVIFDAVATGSTQEVEWHALEQSSGLYFLRAVAQGAVSVQKVALIK